MTEQFAHYPSLAGKSVLVTGGASGIGADIVSAFVAQGARVAFVDRDSAAGQALVAALTGAATPHFGACDLSDTLALRSAIAEAVRHVGEIDVLINNVGNDTRHDFLQVSPEYFDSVVGVNLKAAFFAAQAVVGSMVERGGGSIVNLGSTGWKNKVSGYAAYATCKSAVNGLTRSLAREFGGGKVRVNTLTPGWVMTARQLAQWVDADAERELDRCQCLPGRLQGSDIANMALFLAASDSRMISAQEFVVDAGWT